MIQPTDKSSKSRENTEYILLWRVAKGLGKQGSKIVEAASQGDLEALARIRKFATSGRQKKPAVLRWVNERLEASLKNTAG